MNCLTCKTGTMTESTTAYFAQIENCYVIIERVPCWKCGQCGEIFYKVSVLEKVEEILDTLKKISGKIFVVDYSAAA